MLLNINNSNFEKTAVALQSTRTMITIKQQSIILLFLGICSLTVAQNSKKQDSILNAEVQRQQEIDSFLRMDVFNMKFQYLNDDFSINIDSTTFNKAVRHYKFYPERIKAYNDSLAVVLTYELKSFHGSRIALSRITYQWKKIGYYLWCSEEDAKTLGNSFGFEKPYLFYEFLTSEADTPAEKIKIFQDLKLLLAKETEALKPFDSYKEIMKYGFKHNPERIKDMKQYINSRSRQ